MNMWAAIGSGSFMIALFALLRLGLAKRLPRRVFPALWCLAAVRLLVPVAIRSPLSLWALFARSDAAEPIVWRAEPIAAAPLSGAMAMEAPAGAAVAAGFKFPIWQVLWFAGGLGLALWLGLGYARAVRSFQRGRVVAIPELPRRVRVRVLADHRAPLTYGLFRPVILLPPELAAPGARRTHILTHEWMHIRRWAARSAGARRKKGSGRS